MSIIVGIDLTSGKDQTAFCAAEVRDDGTLFVHDSGFIDLREVCAARARALRKRGEYVRYTRSTVNGKARYQWYRRTK
jgi:hypothetical protein